MKPVRFMLLAVAAALLVAATGGPIEALELVLPWAPLLVVGTLLVSRRFIGESRILARLAPPRRLRRARRPRWSHLRERALASIHSLTTQHLRGPPAHVTA